MRLRRPERKGGCVVLSIRSGHSAKYLTDQVATGRENYYTGAVAAGEPPGRWYGRAAEALGLTGLVDAQDMTALYEHFVDPRDSGFRDPAAWAEADKLGHTGRRYATEEEIYAKLLDAEPDASAERRRDLQLQAGKQARRNVAFWDATFSVQKSITVLHAAFEAMEVKARAAGDEESAGAWGAHRQAVEDAIWVGNNAGLDYLAEKAGYSRIGHHGGAAGRYTDAHDWVIASFFQHHSRDHDPQLHIHNAILNRVQGGDGQWRTLDSMALHRYRGAAAAVAERAMEAHLVRALGIELATPPGGKAREVLGIQEQVTDLFSSRRRAINGKTAELVDAFETQFGRAPNCLELDRLQRQATLFTRRPKTHDGETVEERLERWDRELRAEVAGGLAQVARDVLDLAGRGVPAQEWSPAEVIETALAEVQATRSAWTAPDLTRAISNALPDHLGDLDGRQIAELLDGLTAEALALAVPLDAPRPAAETLPESLRLADGRSAYDAAGAARYATPEHVHSERLLLAATAGRKAPALDPGAAARFIEETAESGIELGVDQDQAVRGILTSGAPVETLVGPAGTGKSFVVGVLARAWQDPALWEGQSRRVFGLASSQIAANVLAGEGLDARNIARWLATQARLADGRAVADDAEWQLDTGDLVVIDESAMTSTADLCAVRRHVEAAGAKLLLTGDHRQLAAVGAGGGMDLLATGPGNAPGGLTYELAETRRFTQPWEREATLRLRDGDPTVLTDYHKHGRLLDCGLIEQAESSAARASLADTLAGRQTLLIVDTNEQAARVSAQLRGELVRLGRVANTGVHLAAQGTYAGVGDLVQTRRNAWHLAGHEGNRRGPINRETFRVVEARDDGGLVVVADHGPGAEPGERLVLPADYVAEHVVLGYACTVHAAQGRTVDVSHTVITASTGAAALYVGMSRGREANVAHVVTRTAAEDAPTGEIGQALHRSSPAVLANALEVADPARTALAEAVESAQEAHAIRTPGELFADAAELATAGRTARWLDKLVDEGILRPDQRVALAAEDGATSLSRILRRAELAGHNAEQVLRHAIADRTLADARQLANVIHHRITEDVSLDPVGESYLSRVPRVEDPEWQAYLGRLAAAAEERRSELAAEVLEQAPQWAIEAFGPVPANQEALLDWTERAATVAAHRELTGHDDPAEAVGRAPKRGQAEAYASWRAAWRALGRPEADRDELEMSNGQLHMRVRAYQREEVWAPRYVANELAGVRQAAESYRQKAALRNAEADTAIDEADRARLQREAAEARALVDVLEQRAAELVEVDDARARWYAHTAETRAAKQRAQAELSARRAADGRGEDELVTAEEWLAAHTAAERDEDPHRVVADEHELADVEAARSADLEAAGFEAPERDAAEEPAADVRAVAAAEPRAEHEDVVRVPTAAETAVAVARAQRALAELQQRQAAEERHAEQVRAEQLTRWHEHDLAADASAAGRDDLEREGVGLGG